MCGKEVVESDESRWRMRAKTMRDDCDGGGRPMVKCCCESPSYCAPVIAYRCSCLFLAHHGSCGQQWQGASSGLMAAQSERRPWQRASNDGSATSRGGQMWSTRVVLALIYFTRGDGADYRKGDEFYREICRSRAKRKLRLVANGGN
ncbi:hypothetical protein NL676_035195 [Syzygium grande]|nr:hypothetical protein NL676_035195 [Syzygium grande]